MKELDIVRLKEEFQCVSKGTRGTIVLDYNSKDCEVEFVDAEGNTIEVLTTSKDKLELVWEYKNGV